MLLISELSEASPTSPWRRTTSLQSPELGEPQAENPGRRGDGELAGSSDSSATLLGLKTIYRRNKCTASSVKDPAGNW